MPIQSLSSADTTLAAMLGTKNGQKDNLSRKQDVLLSLKELFS